MDHPGVKSLLDRIFKQQKPAAPQSTADTEKQVSLKKFTEIDLNSGSTQAASFTRLTDFKDNLKQRMKARRCQIRKEEEEDNEMDEEYHKVVEKKDDDEELNSNSKEVKVIGDDEDEDNEDAEEEEDEDGDASGDSDSNFKLVSLIYFFLILITFIIYLCLCVCVQNLNDDEEEEKDESKKKSKKSSAKTNKIDCYDFDEDDDDDELPDLRLKKNKSEIPLTNSIPSNQLTKVNLMEFCKEARSYYFLILTIKFQNRTIYLNAITMISVRLLKMIQIICFWKALNCKQSIYF